MYKATRAIYNELKKKGDLKVFTDETGSSSDVWLQFGIKNGGSYKIRFISKDDDNDVAVRVYSIISVEDGEVVKVLPALNQLNAQFRYVKFVCDSDGDINVEYDFPVSCVEPEKSAMELVIRIVKIIDEAYPKIMRALFS